MEKIHKKMKELENLIHEYSIMEKREKDKVLAKVIGEEISQALKKNNIQQMEIADLLNLSNADVSNRIHGKIRFKDSEIDIINNYVNLPALERLGIVKRNEINYRTIITDIYNKYNKKQYKISNMEDINAMNEELAKLLYEILDELEALV